MPRWRRPYVTAIGQLWTVWSIASVSHAQQAPVAPSVPVAPGAQAPLHGKPEAPPPSETAPAPARGSGGEPTGGAAADTAAAAVTPDADASVDPPQPTGQLTVVVFLSGGDVAAGVEVLTDLGQSVTTDASGVARIEAAAGERKLTLRVPKPGATDQVSVSAVEQVPVSPGEATSLIVNLDADGTLLSVDVEAPNQVQAEEAGGEAAQAEKAAVFGSIEGVVLSEEKREPIVGARVFLRGQAVEAVTDAAGRFRFDAAPVGANTVSVIHQKFSTQTKSEIEVKEATSTQVELLMVPASVQLDDVVVTAPYIEGGVAALVAERRETTAVADVVGAEQMSQAGDSSAASALKRVTGLSVVGGKFVYVRGMGERYSSTLMNGLNLPSPEPERRVVPMDLFPADILQSVVVQKTYSPEMPGEFGGGSVQLRTQSIPEKTMFSVSTSVGYNSLTTFKEGYTYRGGSSDWLGFDDGTRDLPQDIANAGYVQVIDGGYTREETTALGRSLEPNYRLLGQTHPVDHGLTITAGTRFELGSLPMGALAAVMYDRTYSYKSKTVVRKPILTATADVPDARPGQVLGFGDADRKTTSDTDSTEVSGGTIFVLGARPAPNQVIDATTLLLRMTEDNARLTTGVTRNVSTDLRAFQLQWVERQLLTQQFTGHHSFSTSKDPDTVSAAPVLDWRYGYSQANRKEPDRRDVGYSLNQDQYVTIKDTEGLKRYYGHLEDIMHEGGVDLAWPFELSQQVQFEPTVGASALTRKRDAGGRQFVLAPGSGSRSDTGFRAQDPNFVFAPDNIDADGFEFKEITLHDPSGFGTDFYRARQSSVAGYLKTQTTIADWDVMLGARLERFVQETESYDFLGEVPAAVGRIATTDVLPAATLTWRFFEDFQARLGFGKTVSRPDFREASTTRFFDVENGVEIVGNPDLVPAQILNYDARVEWYPTPDETFSVGVFYKDFTDPIEQTGVAASGDKWSWGNSDSATNLGVELDARVRLDRLADVMEHVFVGANLALIDSTVRVKGATVASEGAAGASGSSSGNTSNDVVWSRERALQGQSPYLINAQLGYEGDDEAGGFQGTLLYNVFGPRIYTVGSTTPDTIEQPYHQLDLVAGYRFAGHFKLSLKVKNIIAARQRITQTAGSETIVTEATPRPREASLGLKWSY